MLKSFYEKGTQYRFLSEAVNQIQYDYSESADVVVIGPPTGGQESGLGNENDEIFNTKDLLEEIAGEVEVFNIRNNGNERITFDGEDSDVVPSPAKKEKQNAKKFKINAKWVKQHIQT